MYVVTHIFHGTKNPSISILSPSISGRIILTKRFRHKVSIPASLQTSGVHVRVPQKTGELWNSFPSRPLGPWLMLLTAHLHICSAAAAWEHSRKGYWFFLYASFLLSKDVWKRKKWSWPMFLPLWTQISTWIKWTDGKHSLCSFKGLNQIRGKHICCAWLSYFVC